MFVFKVHSRCNLDCTYCYVYHHGDDSYLDMPKRVSWDVVEGVAAMVREQHEHVGRKQVQLALHGGEPLLAGRHFIAAMLEHFEEAWRDLEVRITVQTNGVLLDDAWLDVFERHRVRVAVSIDGPPHVNGRFRVYRDGSDSTPETVRGVQHMLARRFPYYRGVISVVHPGADGAELVRYMRDELEAPAIRLLLPDGTHDAVRSDWAATQELLGQVLADAYQEWRKGPDVRIEPFESVIERLEGRAPATPGSAGVTAVVIETDGTLQAHDVLRICPEYARTSGIRASRGALRRFLRSEAYTRGLNLGNRFSATCRTCARFEGCRGGEFEHRYSREHGFMNPSIHCDALYHLVAHVEDDLRRRAPPAAL